MDDQDLFSVFEGAAEPDKVAPSKSIDQLASEAHEQEIARLREKYNASASAESAAAAPATGVKRKLIDLNVDDDEEEGSDADNDDANSRNDGSVAKREHHTLDGQQQQSEEGKTEEEEEAEGEEPVNPLASKDKCLHEVALPPGYEGEDPMLLINRPTDKPPAKEYPFVLDAFQSESVKCLEKKQSVLVSAHTSAGKTAIAEYVFIYSFVCSSLTE